MRILYLSHCDWKWPRQRPQQMAVALAEHGHEVHVRYRPFLRRRGLVGVGEGSDSALRSLRAAWSLVPSRLVTTNPVALAVSRAAVRRLARRTRADVVWFSSAELEPIARTAGVPTVWDCMDLTSLMRGSDGAWSARMHRLEGTAARSAGAVITSSGVLRDEVVRRSNEAHKVSVVHNGFLRAMAWPIRTSPSFVAAYFGTVAEWFDFDLVLEVLEAEPDLQFRIYGPCVVTIPSHPRLRYCGVLPHQDLPAATADVDVFMMPFRVTRMIEAVDPVKLYEYIASGRPAIAPRYTELEKFRPFVELYESPSEVSEILRMVRAHELRGASEVSRAEFLARNSWAERARSADVALEWATRPQLADEHG